MSVAVTSRWIARRVAGLALLLLLPILLAGCGGGGGNAAVAQLQASGATSGTVVVHFSDGVARARAAAPSSYRCTGADGSGQVVYGPLEAFPTSAVGPGGGTIITLSNIPFSVTSLFIVPLAGGQSAGAFERAVSLSAANPQLLLEGFADFSQPTTLALTPSNPPSVAIGNTQAFHAAAVFPDGTRYDVSDQVTWSTAPSAVAGVSAQGVVTGLQVGTVTVTASGLGTTGSTTQVVSPYATTAAVSSSLNPTLNLDSVTFTATVTAVAPASGTPTGTVTFKDGTTTLAAAAVLNGSAQATFTTAVLTSGTHTLTVVYNGDAMFGTSTSAALTQTVNQALFVGDGTSGNVIRMALDGSQQSAYVSGRAQVVGVGFDGSGTLWLTDFGTVGGQGIYSVAPGGGTPVLLGGSATGADYYGLTFDPTGNMLVASGNTGTVSELLAGGTSLTAFLAGLGAPTGVASDAASQVYVAESNAGRVTRWSPAGSLDPTFTWGGLSIPFAVALDSAQAVYVSDLATGTVLKHGSATPFASGFSQVQGLAFDASDNLYAVDAVVHAVYKVTPLGAKSLVTSSGLTNPHGAAIR